MAAGLDPASRRVAFFLLEPGLAMDPDAALRAALRTAAAYRTHNLVRCRGPTAPGLARDMLAQSLVELARGDGRATRLVEAAWAS